MTTTEAFTLDDIHVGKVIEPNRFRYSTGDRLNLPMKALRKFCSVRNPDNAAILFMFLWPPSIIARAWSNRTRSTNWDGLSFKSATKCRCSVRLVMFAMALMSEIRQERADR